MTEFWSAELCRWVTCHEATQLREANMKESFKEMQARCRALETQLKAETDEERRARLVVEWEALKEELAEALKKRGL